MNGPRNLDEAINQKLTEFTSQVGAEVAAEDEKQLEFLRQHGITPESYGVSESDIKDMFTQAREARSEHKWRQKGVEVYCEKCPTPHAFYVSPDVHLVGIDSAGQPILESVEVS